MHLVVVIWAGDLLLDRRMVPGEDEAGGMWAPGIAAEWSAELQDPREDIYTLEDGQPVNAPR